MKSFYIVLNFTSNLKLFADIIEPIVVSQLVSEKKIVYNKNEKKQIHRQTEKKKKSKQNKTRQKKNVELQRKINNKKRILTIQQISLVLDFPSCVSCFFGI